MDNLTVESHVDWLPFYIAFGKSIALYFVPNCFTTTASSSGAVACRREKTGGAWLDGKDLGETSRTTPRAPR